MKQKIDKGYIQVYTGNGKEKTTAAIGQAVRAGVWVKDILRYVNERVSLQ